MRTNIEIDDKLLRQAMKATGQTTSAPRLRKRCAEWLSYIGKNKP